VQLDDAIERFREHIAHERGLSPRTVEAYLGDLALFARHLDPDGERSPDMNSITPLELRAFLAGEVGRGLSSRSMMRRVAALRAFFSFLRTRKLVKTDPTRQLAQRVIPMPPPRAGCATAPCWSFCMAPGFDCGKWWR
jgi:site-specific recombinase XerD